MRRVRVRGRMEARVRRRSRFALARYCLFYVLRLLLIRILFRSGRYRMVECALVRMARDVILER